MNKRLSVLAVITILVWLVPRGTAAQPFAAVGARAAGMGGAFVGVADDATAIYWNPAGLAAGSYFSLTLDATGGEVAPDGFGPGSARSSYFLGLSMPALGLTYYRLKYSTVVPPALLLPADSSLSSRNLSTVPELRLDTLITHHAGVTLVQSIYPGVSVGTTVKLVRGIAASVHVPAASTNEALDHEAADLLGRSDNTFDLDVGVMAAGGPLKAGLTLRNVRQPGFEAAGSGEELVLERQARAGVSYAMGRDWVAAADVDLLRTHDAFGERRDVAAGVEGRLGARVLVRTGFSFNTVQDDRLDGASRAAYSAGGSYAVKAAVYVDGHFTTGTRLVGHQWGVAARFVY